MERNSISTFRESKETVNLLGAAETQQYQSVVVPLIEKTLSSLNQFQGNRSVREARIENGSLFLAR